MLFIMRTLVSVDILDQFNNIWIEGEGANSYHDRVRPCLRVSIILRNATASFDLSQETFPSRLIRNLL